MTALRWFARHRWIWSLLGVLLLYWALALLTSRVDLQSLSGVAVTASFLALTALGQMLVVTTGRGNIDLSVASVITLSAFVAVLTQPLGLAATAAAILSIGLVTGGLNAFLVIGVGIPAIIATLATGYILATAALLANGFVTAARVLPELPVLVAGSLGGIPNMVVLAIVATLAIGGTLRWTGYGRRLSAVGQNHRAAHLSGVRVGAVVASTFLSSALLAALTGLLLGAYVGGAFLEMGASFVLQSIGAVVLGGSLIAGGSSTALGCLFGSLLLVLIVTTTQIAGLPPGTQDVIQGIVIIAVLSLAGGVPAARVVGGARTKLFPGGRLTRTASGG